MTRLALAVVVLAGLAVLAVTFTRSDTVSNPPTPLASNEERVVLMGLRGRTSDPFFLDGGSYRGIWSAWGETPSDPPCTHSVALMAVDSANATGPIYLASLVQVPSTGTSEEVDMPDLEPGDYYFQVASACAWQIELSPY